MAALARIASAAVPRLALFGMAFYKLALFQANGRTFAAHLASAVLVHAELFGVFLFAGRHLRETIILTGDAGTFSVGRETPKETEDKKRNYGRGKRAHIHLRRCLKAGRPPGIDQRNVTQRRATAE